MGQEMGNEGAGQVGFLPTRGHLKCLEAFGVIMTGEYYCPARTDNRDAAKPLPMQRTDPPLQSKKEKS